jgi:hypothetical protein
VLLGTWPFMQRRERLISFLSAGTFAALAWFAPAIDRYSPIADPASLTSLIVRANESAADPTLAALIAATPSRGLEAEQQTALGMLAMRAGNQEKAVGHFLLAIEKNPRESIALVNLGNVYYLNGHYDKALEGYRKAEERNATDAVGQYNLAQAYIKTLLMDESSQALKRASQAGFDPIRGRFAERARHMVHLSAHLRGRRILAHGRHRGPARQRGRVSAVLACHRPSPCLGFCHRGRGHSALGDRRAADQAAPSRVQCSNCGEITCTAAAVTSTTPSSARRAGRSAGDSDKVMDALPASAASSWSKAASRSSAHGVAARRTPHLLRAPGERRRAGVDLRGLYGVVARARLHHAALGVLTTDAAWQDSACARHRPVVHHRHFLPAVLRNAVHLVRHAHALIDLHDADALGLS